MALTGEDFQPSNKYILMSRDKFNEIKMNLERIKTSITVDKAADIADNLLTALKNKYDRPAYADALKAELERTKK